MVIGLVMIILTIIAKLIKAISRRREFCADARCRNTRQPSGLIDALKKIAARKISLESANPTTAHVLDNLLPKK
jgi:Zn-dependent protease with chaperone function